MLVFCVFPWDYYKNVVEMKKAAVGPTLTRVNFGPLDSSMAFLGHMAKIGQKILQPLKCLAIHLFLPSDFGLLLYHRFAFNFYYEVGEKYIISC